MCARDFEGLFFSLSFNCNFGFFILKSTCFILFMGFMQGNLNVKRKNSNSGEILV
jgi:hypothetical protein